MKRRWIMVWTFGLLLPLAGGNQLVNGKFELGLAGYILGDAGLFEKAVHLLAGHTPRIGVGNDYGPVPGEELRKEFRHAGKCSDAEYHGPGIGCPRQSAFNFIHDELFWVT